MKKRQPIKVPRLPKKKGRPFKPPRPEVPKTLTAKEQRFVEEYCVDLNATQAAIRSGYSRRSAAEIASENLRKPQIAKAVADYKAALAARACRTRADIERELEKMGFANLLDYFHIDASGQPHIDLSAVTRDQAAAVTEITVDDYVDGRGEDARDVKRVRIKMADRRASLMDLAKLRGWVVDKGEVKVEDVSAKAIHDEIRGKTTERLRLELSVYNKVPTMSDANLTALLALAESL